MGGGKERKGKERKGKEKENVKYIHIFRRSFVSCFNEHHQGLKRSKNIPKINQSAQGLI